MNYESNRPLYLQIEADIRNSITNKKYKPGEKLPTENELSDQYKVSKITIRKAMDKLSKDGLVQKVQGKGTFITYKKEKLALEKSKGFKESLMDHGHTSKNKILQASFLKADTDIAEKLKIKPDDDIIYLERLIWEDGVPCAIDKIYLGEKEYPNFITKLTEDRSFYKILQDSYSISPSKSILEINGIIATRDTAKLLDCNIGDPLFYIEKIGYTDNNKPIHYSISTVRCDRVSYVITTNNSILMNQNIK